MKKILSAVLIGLLVLMPLSVAQEISSDLPNPGITPDSPLYGLKRAWEAIQMAFTFDEAKKAELKLKFAEKRLAEAEAMAEKNKTDLAEKAFQEYIKELNETNRYVERAMERGKNVTELIEHIEERHQKHIYVLQRVLENVPEEAKPAIELAINRSLISEEKISEHIQEMKQIAEQVREMKEEMKQNMSEIKKNATELKENLTETAKKKMEDLKGKMGNHP